jgi:hypothetical protein
MNWEAIDAISGAIGSLVVVISLIYVGIQIRQNTKVARSAARQAITELLIESNKDIVNDPSLAEAFIKDLNGEKLGEVDRLRVLSRAYFAIRNWENIFYQYRTGMLTKDEWRGFRLNLQAIFEWETVRRVWENEQEFFSEAFQGEVGDILKGIPDSKVRSHKYAVSKEGDDKK